MHGLTATTYIWDPIFTSPRLLTPGRLLIRYDCRGHGRSDKPDASGDFPPAYSGEAFASDFAAVATAWGFSPSTTKKGQKVLGVAWSIGCATLSELPRHGVSRNLVDGYLYLAPYAWPALGAHIAGPIAMECIPVLRGLRPASEEELENARRKWVSNFSSQAEGPVPGKVVEKWLEAARLLRPEVARQYGGRQEDDAGQAIVAAVVEKGTPLVLLHGTADLLLDCDKTIEVTGAAFGDAAAFQAVRLQGAGHHLMWDTREEVVDWVIEVEKRATDV